eukprot:6653450-Prymnesium_polylepis.1
MSGFHFGPPVRCLPVVWGRMGPRPGWRWGGGLQRELCDLVLSEAARNRLPTRCQVRQGEGSKAPQSPMPLWSPHRRSGAQQRGKFWVFGGTGSGHGEW